MEYWFGLPRQSGLMLAARITLLHFSVSSPMSFPKSSRGAGERCAAQISAGVFFD
jgi:hypothetical protein